MQRSAAAESHQRELARVVSTLDRDDADGSFHLRVDDAENAGRKLLGGCERALLVAQNCFGSLPVEVHASAEKGLRIETSQQEVRVGDGGLCSASKADWSRIGSRRLRSHAQHASGIEARNRTAARAGSVNVEHRHADGHAGHDGFACPLCAARWPRRRGKRRSRCRPCRIR